MTLRTTSLFALGLFAAGCAAVTVPDYGADHPANRDAAQSARAPRSQALSTGGASQMRAARETAPEPASEHEHGDDVGLYACPMHPEVTSDAADSCPICGMDLVEKPKPATDALYVCPMHPDVTSNTAQSCPICGMELIKKPPSEDGDRIHDL